MASSWGLSWRKSWAGSWGLIPQKQGGDDAPGGWRLEKSKEKFRKATTGEIRKALKVLLEAHEKPAVSPAIVADVKGVITAPKVDWIALQADLDRVWAILEEAKRIREADDEETILLLM